MFEYFWCARPIVGHHFCTINITRDKENTIIGSTEHRPCTILHQNKPNWALTSVDIVNLMTLFFFSEMARKVMTKGGPLSRSVTHAVSEFQLANTITRAFALISKAIQFSHEASYELTRAHVSSHELM